MSTKRWYKPEHFKLIGHTHPSREKRMIFYAILILMIGTFLFILSYYNQNYDDGSKKAPENQSAGKNR
jgi:hypothetical protein